MICIPCLAKSSHDLALNDVKLSPSMSCCFCTAFFPLIADGLIAAASGLDVNDSGDVER